MHALPGSHDVLDTGVSAAATSVYPVAHVQLPRPAVPLRTHAVLRAIGVGLGLVAKQLGRNGLAGRSTTHGAVPRAAFATGATDLVLVDANLRCLIAATVVHLAHSRAAAEAASGEALVAGAGSVVILRVRRTDCTGGASTVGTNRARRTAAGRDA